MLIKKNLTTLATQLHDNMCPVCNGRCHNICNFMHQPKEDDWENNIYNNYFLDLARKGFQIMEETGITEEQLISYAVASITYQNIPENVFNAMQKFEFN